MKVDDMSDLPEHSRAFKSKIKVKIRHMKRIASNFVCLSVDS